MTKTNRTGRLLRCVALSALLIAPAGLAGAEPFAGLGAFDGRIGASGPERGPIVAGGEAQISARGFQPGQSVVLRQGGSALPGSPFTADDEGTLEATVTIPEGAAPGVYPVVAELGGDAPFATIFDLKVSKVLGPLNTERYATQSAEIVRNPYQVAVTGDAIFVTGAVGRPPVRESELAKIDPETLEIVARVSPPAAPARDDGSDGGVFAVYGIGVDAEAGQVWVTNTRQDTVAVYSTEDLSLIKQFEPGTVAHSRDVVAFGGKAYVTATFEPRVHVFDTETLEQLAPIELTSARRGEDFTAASLSLAPEAGKLFVSSLRSEEVAVIDLATGTQSGGFPVENSSNTIGLAASPDGARVYTVAQGNDAVTILDAVSGEQLGQVNLGAGPLNAVVEPASGNVFVALRVADAVAVISPEGEILANLEIGSTPNHLTRDADGNVWVVNKSGGEGDDTANRLTRITAE
ncbi:MAG: YncE family protein [Salipiger thiooxidans]|uniref:YncE family protein n=1 Tax=Salipiger thiooxidans TaxID=282683 RepID=UPI001CFB406B|nr:YncE family protein [Salipiger thiooxidans]